MHIGVPVVVSLIETQPRALLYPWLSMGWVDPRVGLGWVGSGMGRKSVFSGLGWVMGLK